MNVEPSQLEHEEITGVVIGAAIEVHKALGPGFIESVYEKALIIELEHRSIPWESQVCVPVMYRGIEVGVHRLDLLVANEIVVELKAIQSINDTHFAVARSYLRAMDRKHGLIINFSKPTIEVKRVITT